MLATVATGGAQIGPKLKVFVLNLTFFLFAFSADFQDSLLKRKLRRGFRPQGLPKAVPRGARGLPRHSLFHLGAPNCNAVWRFRKAHEKRAHVFVILFYF